MPDSWDAWVDKSIKFQIISFTRVPYYSSSCLTISCGNSQCGYHGNYDNYNSTYIKLLSAQETQDK